MTGPEFNAACEAVGLATQGQRAAFLGVSLRTAHSYSNGAPIPEAVAKLLRLMVARRIKAAKVE